MEKNELEQDGNGLILNIVGTTVERHSEGYIIEWNYVAHRVTLENLEDSRLDET